MELLATVTPNLDRQSAIARFRSRQWRLALRSFQLARLASVLEFFIPYHICRVTVSDRGVVKLNYRLAFDALEAMLDPIDLEGVPIQCASCERLISTPSTHQPFQVTGQSLPDRVRKLVYAKYGGFNLHEPELSVSLVQPGIYVPYWVGLYRRGDAVDFEVLNALTGQIEGGKVRSVVADWLAQA